VLDGLTRYGPRDFALYGEMAELILENKGAEADVLDKLVRMIQGVIGAQA